MRSFHTVFTILFGNLFILSANSRWVYFNVTDIVRPINKINRTNMGPRIYHDVFDDISDQPIPKSTPFLRKIGDDDVTLRSTKKYRKMTSSTERVENMMYFHIFLFKFQLV